MLTLTFFSFHGGPRLLRADGDVDGGHVVYAHMRICLAGCIPSSP